MERYTLEDHEAYRKEQDEKAAKEENARNERMEKESARRAWLAENAHARQRAGAKKARKAG